MEWIVWDEKKSTSNTCLLGWYQGAWIKLFLFPRWVPWPAWWLWDFFSNKILKIVTSVLMHSRELLQGEKNFVAQFYFCLFETTGLFQDIGMQNFLKSDSLTIPWSGHPKAVVKTRKNRFENMKMLWYFQMSTGVELKEWTNDSLVLDLSKLIHSFLVEIPIISEMLCCLISA